MAHDRKTTHKDVNHNAIKRDLLDLGYEVDDVCAVPGLYDVIVTGIPLWSERAVSVRVEIKRPELRAKGLAALTPAEKVYWDKFHFDNLIMAWDVEDILAWFGRGVGV